MKTPILVVVSGLILASLAGCAASPPQVITTPGPTVTVTSTPTPVAEDPDHAITPLEAWTVCAGVAQGVAAENPGAVFVPMTDTDLANNVSTDASGVIYVNIFLTPPADFPMLAVLCHVSGTLANPTVEYTTKTH